MAELTVELTYGQALLDAARETGKEQEILESSSLFIDALDSNPELADFLNYPAISAEEKKDVIGKVFEGSLSPEFLNFLFVLIDKRRTGAVRGIIRTYGRLLEKEEGVSYGIVYSVEKLTEDRLVEIEKQTSKLLKINAKLENETDPKLIAGIKVLIEGKIIDASYRKKFDELAGRLNLA